MKIGILTFHRTFNYGAVLQCYALQQILGQNAEVIDYRQRNIEKTRRIFFKPRFMLTSFFSFKWMKIVNNVRMSLKHKHIYDSFVCEYIRISKRAFYKKSDYSNYDIIVIGSDQLWNASICGNFDEVYAGEVKKGENISVYGYAISTDNRNVTKISKDFIDKVNKNFKIVSFREEPIKNYLFKSLKCDVRVDLDPTFLLDSKQWESIAKSFDVPSEYVFFYTIRGKYEELKKNVEMSLSSLSTSLLDVKKLNLSVGEFLYAVKESKYVITSSFHGLAFAIIFRKPFYYLETDSNMDGRASNILDVLGLQYLIKYNVSDDICQIPCVDWSMVNSILDNRRQSSLAYLNSIVKGGQL